jgi:hypothetical protein
MENNSAAKMASWLAVATVPRSEKRLEVRWFALKESVLAKTTEIRLEIVTAQVLAATKTVAKSALALFA